MPDVYADNMSLQVFHSGGPGWQPSVELCLGGERAITPAVMLTVQRYSAIGGIRIERVEAANGPGIGYMDAPDTDSLRWKAPGDTNYGETVDIAVGETRVLPSEDGDKCIQVTRVLTNDLASTELVCLVDTYNNICSGPNFVSEDASGNTYSLAAIYNGGSVAVTLTQMDATGCSVFFELPVADAVQITADEFTAPAGASWITTWSAGDIVIAAGGWYGLWIKRAFTATISAQLPATIELTYTSGAVTGLRCDLRGLTRRGQASHESLLLFVGIDAQPNYAGAPADSGATLADLTYDITPAEEHTYYWEILDRNPFGLLTVSEGAAPYYVAADGTGEPAPPADPSQVFLLAQEDGTILVSAEYTGSQDSTANRANRWLVYQTFDGTAPDPVVDTPIEYLLAVGLPMEHITAAQVDDTPYKVIVHTARYDSDAVLEAESLDDTIYTATATYVWFPTRRPDVTLGSGQGQKVEFVEPSETVVIDVGTNCRWIITASNTQLWYGATLVYVLTDTALRTTFAFQTGTVSGAAAASVEVASSKIYFSVAGVRVLEINPATATITVGSIDESVTVDAVNEPGATWVRYGELAFPVYSPVTGVNIAAFSVTSAGVVETDIAVIVCNTDGECF